MWSVVTSTLSNNIGAEIQNDMASLGIALPEWLHGEDAKLCIVLANHSVMLQNPITHQGCGYLRFQLCRLPWSWVNLIVLGCFLGVEHSVSTRASPAWLLEVLPQPFPCCQQLHAKCPLVPQWKHSWLMFWLHQHSLARWPGWPQVKHLHWVVMSGCWLKVASCFQLL